MGRGAGQDSRDTKDVKSALVNKQCADEDANEGRRHATYLYEAAKVLRTCAAPPSFNVEHRGVRVRGSAGALCRLHA